ncbi:MAG TPA: sodium-independent anion transporter, partial [Micromonospora sp.]
TLALDLVAAVLIGLLVAGALALRKIAMSVRVEELPLDADGPLTVGEETALLAEHIVVYRLDGPLFFAAAHRFLLELTEVTDVRVVILRMSRVSTLDASGALVLGDAIRRMEHRGVTVLLSGIRPQHAATLRALGILDRPDGTGRVFADVGAAIGAAHERLGRAGLLPTLAATGANRPD